MLKLFQTVEQFFAASVRIFWPNVILNKDLYERCWTEAIATILVKRCWRRIGHVTCQEASIAKKLLLTGHNLCIQNRIFVMSQIVRIYCIVTSNGDIANCQLHFTIILNRFEIYLTKRMVLLNKGAHMLFSPAANVFSFFFSRKIVFPS